MKTRFNIIPAILAVVALVPPLTAYSAPNRTTVPPLTGSYFGSFTLQDPNPLPFTTFPALMTFHSDGTLVETDGASLVDSPPGQPPNFSSAGHGVWQQVKAHTYHFKFISLSVGPDGTTAFTLVVAGVVEVNRDGTVRGHATYQAFDPSGTAIEGLNGSSTLQLQRITLE